MTPVRTVARRSMDEEQLVALAREGDRDAFRALYLLHIGSVRAFLARRCERSDLDDLTAETFAHAFQRLDRFTWQGMSMRPWLLRIAHRRLLARVRRRSASEIVSDDCDPGDVHEDADAVIDRLDAAGAVRDALGALTDVQRTVIKMRYVDELPAAEVGRALGLSDEAVRATAHRALATLRRTLGTARSPVQEG